MAAVCRRSDNVINRRDGPRPLRLSNCNVQALFITFCKIYCWKLGRVPAVTVEIKAARREFSSSRSAKDGLDVGTSAVRMRPSNNDNLASAFCRSASNYASSAGYVFATFDLSSSARRTSKWHALGVSIVSKHHWGGLSV